MFKKITSSILFGFFVLAFLFSGVSHAYLVDDGFNPDANSNINCIVRQADGKILVGGAFTKIGGQDRNYIARLNEDGSVDATFNPYANETVYSIALQADGKILVGAYFTKGDFQERHYIVRFNSDGTLDTTFNAYVLLFGHVLSMVVQADGKILVAVDNYLFRLNDDGTLDTAFNRIVGSVYSFAVQGDGKILVGGWIADKGGLIRLNEDGSVDSTFNTYANNSVHSIAVQTDGKILVGGLFTTIGDQTRLNMARLNADGTLDTTFKTTVGKDAYERNIVCSIAVQADGKILIGGSFYLVNGQYRYNIARLKPDGKLDTPFNPGANSQVNSIAVQTDGNILVGGYFSTIDGQERHCIARLKGEVPMFSAQEYLPLEPGTIWKYIRNGKSTVTRRVFNEEIIVNGVKTRPVKYVEENVTEYLTNGKNGINLHRQYQPNVYVGGVGWVDVDVTFVPPIKLADSEVWIGQKIRSIGTTQMVLWPSGKTYYFGYWAETTIEAEEQVTVPAGTFNTVRYKESIEVYDQYMETTRYLAKGIGIVKDITLNPGGARSTYELKSMTLLNLLAPDGGESIPSGGTYDIPWQASPEMAFFKLKYSIDDGATWLPIKGAEHVTDNHYLWTVPMPVNNKTSCRVKVKGYDSSNVLLETDVSEKPFTIEVVRVTSPNGGEVWSSGELRPITWLTNETIRPVAEIQLYYTKNNGITWLPITTITGSNPGTYDWIVPPMTKVKKNCKVKLKLKDSAGNSIGSDVSDQVFTVQPLP